MMPAMLCYVCMHSSCISPLKTHQSSPMLLFPRKREAKRLNSEILMQNDKYRHTCAAHFLLFILTDKVVYF